MGDIIQGFIFNNFVPDFGDSVQNYLKEATQKTSQLTITFITYLLVIALILISTIDSALNYI